MIHEFKLLALSPFIELRNRSLSQRGVPAKNAKRRESGIELDRRYN